MKEKVAPLISLRSLAPSLPLFFLFLFPTFAKSPQEIYNTLCAKCHHEDRIGRIAPPLGAEFLKRKSDEYLKKVIREGIPSTTMPSFPELTDDQLNALIDYIRKPLGSINYDLEEVKRSYAPIKREKRGKRFKNLKDLVVFVDKGGTVYLLEGTRVLDSFPFKNVHGGVKFSPEGDVFFVPARDGWVISYDLKEMKPKAKVRPCIYLRNIAFSVRTKTLAVACTLPKKIVFLSEDLVPLRERTLEGKPSAVYEVTKAKDYEFVLTYRDIPRIALLDSRGREKTLKTEAPLEDFFIDPFEEFIVGTSRQESKLYVYRLSEGRKVFEAKVKSMPHLFSSAFWYSDGGFYFATRHVGSSEVTVWRMYDWRLEKTLKVGGKGFFVRTSPGVPELWVDLGREGFALIDKKTLSVRRVSFGGIATHVEFSPEGNYAYVSLLGKDPSLLVVDPITLERLKTLPAQHPAGKYNFVLKTRKFYPSLLGYEVFMSKCWGCHHPTEEAFGPPLRDIALKRSKELIASQILNPEETSKLLGYKENAMPKINISSKELEAIMSFMEGLKDEARLAKGD